MFPVVFVLAIVGWAYYVFVFLLVPKYLNSEVRYSTPLNSYYSQKKGQGVGFLILFHIAFIVFLSSFLRTVFSSPGMFHLKMIHQHNSKDTYRPDFLYLLSCFYLYSSTESTEQPSHHYRDNIQFTTEKMHKV
jgi:hypothetical protein